MLGYRVRPTIRCLEEDLDLRLPPFGSDLCELKHPVLNKARDLAPKLSALDRVLAIKELVVNKFPHGRRRCAAWQEKPDSTFCEPLLTWVLGAKLRADGSRKDAYEQFEALHAARRLLPGESDIARHHQELSFRIINACQREARLHLLQVQANRGRDQRFRLGGVVHGRIHQRVDAGDVCTWIALDKRDFGPLPPTDSSALRLVIFAAFCDAAGWDCSDQTTVWADGVRVPHWEEAALFALE